MPPFLPLTEPIMAELYIIYSLRAQGWVYRNGGYGSLYTEAKDFTRGEAVAYAKRAGSPQEPSPLIPVPLQMYKEVLL